MTYSLKSFSSIAQIGKDSWQRAFANGGPTLQYSFLLALEESHSVGPKTGWTPHFIGIYKAADLVALLPGYSKSHSYGEYIFDHAWANAYAQHGFNYYPKWICAVPFTPITKQRIGFIELVTNTAESTDNSINRAAIIDFLGQALPEYITEQGFSSAHLLFVNHTENTLLNSETKLSQRWSLQFEWQNQNYTDFTDYLSWMVSRKRKSIKKERNKIAKQGISVKQHFGTELSSEHMAFFYECYKITYLKRSGHEGYLTRNFFERLYSDMAEHILLVIAYENERPIAAAFFLYDTTELYGRYWGALNEADGLHFECCYYQGIEFAIQQKIQRFNPGTQGEHKILRGFAPTYCHSYHLLNHPDFAHAVEDFVQREKPAIQAYKLQCDELLPFRKENESL